MIRNMRFAFGYDTYEKSGKKSQPIAVAIGMFDGVHLGHQEVIAQVIQKAKRENLHSAAITFDRHPASVFRPESSPPLIYPLEKRIQCLLESGLDFIFALQFDSHLCKLSPNDFVDELHHSFPALCDIFVGRDFGFGHRRSGNIKTLQELSSRYGFEAHEVKAFQSMGENVSSTFIREQINKGELAKISSLLGRPYSINGVVEKGKRMGHTIGFPTANISLNGLCHLPFGVYSGLARIEGQEIPSIGNIGMRPTLNPTPVPLAEVHMFDFDADVYGKKIEWIPTQFLRPERKFESISDLKERITEDCKAARQTFSQHPWFRK